MAEENVESASVAKALLRHIAAVVAARARAQQRFGAGKSLHDAVKALSAIERPPELENDAEEAALWNAAAALDHVQRLESAGAPAEITAPLLDDFRRSHDRRWVELLLAHRSELAKAFGPLHRGLR